MKRKTVIALLTAALAGWPAASQQQPPPNPKLETWMELCSIEVVGGVFMAGLICIYWNGIMNTGIEMTSAPPPMPPRPTSPPSTNAPPTNAVSHALSIIPSGPVTQINLTGSGWMDTNAPAITPYTNLVMETLQIADSLGQWRDAYHLTCWVSAGGSLLQAQSVGGDSMVSYAARGPDGKCRHQMPFTLGTGQEPQRYFRLTSYER